MWMVRAIRSFTMSCVLHTGNELASLIPGTHAEAFRASAIGAGRTRRPVTGRSRPRRSPAMLHLQTMPQTTAQACHDRALQGGHSRQLLGLRQRPPVEQIRQAPTEQIRQASAPRRPSEKPPPAELQAVLPLSGAENPPRCVLQIRCPTVAALALRPKGRRWVCSPPDQRAMQIKLSILVIIDSFFLFAGSTLAIFCNVAS